MDDLTQKPVPPQPAEDPHQELDTSELERRELLQRLGKLVIYTAPAVIAIFANSQSCMAS